MPDWPNIGRVSDERTPVFKEGDWQYINCSRGTVSVSSVNFNDQVRECEAAFVVFSDAVKAGLVKPHWKFLVESVYCHSATTIMPGLRKAEIVIAHQALNYNNCFGWCSLSGGVEEIKGEFVKVRGVAGDVLEVHNRQAQHLLMLYFS